MIGHSRMYGREGTMGVTRTKMKIVKAGREHAGFLAWVMLTAHRSHLERGLWDFIVGGSEAECLRYLEALAVTEQAHWAHYSTFIVAEVDGRPAAALCGYSEAEHGTPSLVSGMADANRVVGRSEERPRGWGAVSGCRGTRSLSQTLGGAGPPRGEPCPGGRGGNEGSTAG